MVVKGLLGKLYIGCIEMMDVYNISSLSNHIITIVSAQATPSGTETAGQWPEGG